MNVPAVISTHSMVGFWAITVLLKTASKRVVIFDNIRDNFALRYGVMR